MKAVVQRVLGRVVEMAGEVVGEIARGVLVLLGVAPRRHRGRRRQPWPGSLCALRIFPGRTPMDLALADVGGACLLVSQFTLAADLGKGNRPSFEPAEAPGPRRGAVSTPSSPPSRRPGVTVATGRFGADMQVLSATTAR